MDHIRVPFKPAKEVKLLPKTVKATKAFAKEYANKWAKRAGKPRSPISQDSKLWRDMEAGRRMADRLHMGYAEFIEAQVDGLQIIREGAFPMPNQLHTAQAELRAIRWNEGGGAEGGDKDLRLDERYVWAVQRLKAGTADLKEARYVARCQRRMLGRVHPRVKSYIKERRDGK